MPELLKAVQVLSSFDGLEGDPAHHGRIDGAVVGVELRSAGCHGRCVGEVGLEGHWAVVETAAPSATDPAPSIETVVLERYFVLWVWTLVHV